MGRSIIKESRTIEEARTLALEELGAAEEDVEIEVLDDGKSGFLGFGGRNARVRVTLKNQPVAAEIVEGGSAPGGPEPAEVSPGLGAAESAIPHGGESRPEPAADAEKVRELLSGMIQGMHMQGTVETRTRDGRLVANVIGEDSNLLIGKRGQTLDAIQFLLNLMYSKSMKRRANVVVDVEDYKVRREQRLRNMALDVRDKVRRSNKPIAIAPMNAQDRRIIHLALQDDESVKTVSRGEGLLRKVVVIPKETS